MANIYLGWDQLLLSEADVTVCHVIVKGNLN